MGIFVTLPRLFSKGIGGIRCSVRRDGFPLLLRAREVAAITSAGASRRGRGPRPAALLLYPSEPVSPRLPSALANPPLDSACDTCAALLLLGAKLAELGVHPANLFRVA